MVSSTDHLSAKTSASPVVTISKAGAAFGAAAGAVTEIGSGWYSVAFTTADTGTLNDLAVHITGSGADDTDFVDQVVAVDLTDATAFGLSRLDAAISSRMATFTLPTNFSSLSIDASGRVDLGKWVGVAPNALISGRVDANAQVVGDKTGYSLTQTFPTNFSSLSIDASGRVDLGKWIGVAPSALVSGMVQSASVVRSSTTQAGSAAGTIVLDSGASATTDFYKDCWIWDVTTGQVRLCTGYNGATKTASVAPNWQTTPGTGDTFIVLPAGETDLGLWAGVAPNALISGRVDANAQVVGDKTGYSLTQSFPTNFSLLSIDGSGRVDVGKWVGVAPNALISGNVPANIQATAVGVIDATALNASAVQKIHQYTTEGSITFEQLCRIVLSGVAGISNSHQLGTPNYRDQANSKNRIAATTDVNGNRTAVTVDGT